VTELIEQRLLARRAVFNPQLLQGAFEHCCCPTLLV
jgi:hypothetical protein